MKKNVHKPESFYDSIKTKLINWRVPLALFCVLTILQINAIEIYAQQRVTGTVTTSSGEQLPGVNVTVKGTTIGVMTDINGNFTIDAPNNQSILVFSFIGFEPQEITVGSQTRINVTLRESAIGLDEVVVTALGIRRETKALAYAVQEVKGETFATARAINVAASMSGRIAGVDAVQINASGAGASSRVVIRGNNSLTGNNQPLYVIDGMPITNENKTPGTSTGSMSLDRGDGISSINPDDIESISVLKGGAAAALYGSQAANGVVLITTKKGTAQRGVGVEISSDVIIGFISIYPTYQYEYGQGQFGTYPANAAEGISSGRLGFGAKIDGTMQYVANGELRPYSAVNIKKNLNNFLDPLVYMTNTIAFNAGNQNLQTRLSFSDNRSKEQQPNSNFYRKTVSMNSRAVLGPKDLIIIESSAQYHKVDAINRPGMGNGQNISVWSIYMAAPTVDIRDWIGDPKKPGIHPNTGRELEWNPVPSSSSAWYHAYQHHDEDHRDRFLGRTSVQINVHPKVFIKGTAAIDFLNYSEQTYVPATSAFTPLGYLRSAKEFSNKTNFQAIANYSGRLLADNIGFNLMAGVYSERDKFLRNQANGTEWVLPDFFSLTNLKNRDIVNETERRSGTNSIFGEANVDWKSIVFLTFTGRQDWFSVLNPDKNSVFYPSVGGSVIISQIVNLPNFFNFAKIRGSWAQVGQATVTVGQINQEYEVDSNNTYGLPTVNNPNRLHNPNLLPAIVTTTEAGFQVNFFDSRLGLDVNRYFKKTINNQLSPPISATTGYQSGPMNLGIITNKGWEITFTGTPISKRNFSWDVAFNFGYNKSEVVELAEGIEFLSLGSGWGSITMINAPGMPYSTLRSWRMKRTENGELIYNRTTGYEVREQVDIGTGNPPTNIGLNNNFRYKNFTLTVDIDSKFGAYGYSNQIEYATRFGLTPITLPGRGEGLTVTGVDEQGNPFSYFWSNRLLSTYYNNFGVNYPSMWTYNTDFAKLRRAVLRYDLPAKFTRPLRIERASIAVTGQNLLILYQSKGIKEVGLDPEMSAYAGNAQGAVGANMPPTRNIGFNVNIRF